MLRPRICLCGDVFFKFCPRLFLFLTEEIWISSLTICESRGKIASPSHVKHSSWLIESERLMQASTLHSCQAANHSCFPCSLSQCILKYISVNTQLSALRSDLLLDMVAWPFSFSLCHHVCFTALPVASLRALTQKAGLRTLRTATWPTLWSGSSPASLTRCAQRAEWPRNTSRACTAWSQVHTMAHSVHSHSATVLIPSALYRVSLGCVYSQLGPTEVNQLRGLCYWHVQWP